jgi:hypothetical protein
LFTGVNVEFIRSSAVHFYILGGQASSANNNNSNNNNNNNNKTSPWPGAAQPYWLYRPDLFVLGSAAEVLTYPTTTTITTTMTTTTATTTTTTITTEPFVNPVSS